MNVKYINMDMFSGWEGSVEISDTKKCNAIPINNFGNYGNYFGTME